MGKPTLTFASEQSNTGHPWQKAHWCTQNAQASLAGPSASRTAQRAQSPGFTPTFMNAGTQPSAGTQSSAAAPTPGQSPPMFVSPGISVPNQIQNGNSRHEPSVHGPRKSIHKEVTYTISRKGMEYLRQFKCGCTNPYQEICCLVDDNI